MKKACVFGGSGFLGSHIADHLNSAGYEVIVFDTKPSKWLNSRQKMIIGSILEYKQVEKAISGSEIVYNCAALSDLEECLYKPLEAAKINILGNLNIMEACIKKRVKRFIFSSSVYVNSREGGFYRCSKQASENFIEEYNQKYGLKYSILRYGSLYGPRSDKFNGVHNIVKKAVETGVVMYQGDPDTVREYIHIDDAAHASVKIALKKEFCNQTLILTGQEQMPIFRLLKMISEIIGIKKKIKFLRKKKIGHYLTTPYAYNNKLIKKFIPDFHVDLGQGLLQLVKQIKNEK
jgi:UDP-glucose 4-epimerase